jgi:hypothetical protein
VGGTPNGTNLITFYTKQPQKNVAPVITSIAIRGEASTLATSEAKPKSITVLVSFVSLFRLDHHLIKLELFEPAANDTGGSGVLLLTVNALAMVC